MYLKNPSGAETVFVLDPKRILWCEVYVGTAVNIARTPRTVSETDCNLKKLFESGEDLLLSSIHLTITTGTPIKLYLSSRDT